MGICNEYDFLKENQLFLAKPKISPELSNIPIIDRFIVFVSKKVYKRLFYNNGISKIIENKKISSKNDKSFYLIYNTIVCIL